MFLIAITGSSTILKRKISSKNIMGGTIMNSIVKTFLESHIKAYELENDEPSSLEHLMNYLAVRNYTSRYFNPSDISLGKGEVGIDGVAIIVNDTLVTTLDQIKDFFSNSNDISAAFVFVQTKTSESFDTSALSHFFTSVNDFLNDGKIKMNKKASEMHSICRYIVENPTQLSKNPDCHLFFSFTGKDTENKTKDSIVNNQIDRLRESSVFDEITFSLYDSDKIVSACRSIKNMIKKTIEMTDCAVIPKIHNVPEAYIGIARCSDYIKLITNDDGAIISNLFEDNVRYFQGQNTINAEIQSTLRDTEKQQEFSILNNGVTIVAREIRRTGNSFTLTDYQVINGCQTSFVLFENRGRLVEDACLVVKLISTTNKDISDSIVKTTNRQTPVLNEAFETLRDFHKNLENVYAAYQPEYRLYYERRSKQYDASDINKNRIVSFSFQTAAYVAVFLAEPQSTHRYYGELLKSYNKRMYNDNDVLEQYCIASMLVYAVDKRLRRDDEKFEFNKYRFHIALMLRCMANSKKTPQPNSREMKSYCEEIYQKIKDEVWLNTNIEKSCTIISEIVNSKVIKPKDGNAIERTREFTQLLLDKLGIKDIFTPTKSQLPPLQKGTKVKCRVINWNNSFAYVEILNYKEIGSIHIRLITGTYIRDIGDKLKENQEIEATILDNTPHPVFGYNLSML